ncbi:hypothetical protein BG74_07760 [Sodalis-like endosymbiont of Proechinophthirus fluctus]|nr:hypothetical protein BG74_07760 [Sodalis-like endosymbiont of Proechinophthirus fluctus]
MEGEMVPFAVLQANRNDIQELRKAIELERERSTLLPASLPMIRMSISTISWRRRAKTQNISLVVIM